MKAFPKIALGAWAWGNDGTFGADLSPKALKPVFDTAMDNGLYLWDTAYAYGMGISEKTLAPEEVAELETLGESLGLDVVRDWEKEMK